jgi:hypothetical protein
MNFHQMIRAAATFPIRCPEGNGGCAATNRAQMTITDLRTFALDFRPTGELTEVLDAAGVKRRVAKKWGTRILRAMLPRDRRLTGPRLSDLRRAR